jgi:hypothetical protein
MMETLTNGDRRIVIVGQGPRGLSVLERIVAIARTMTPPAYGTLTIDIIDPYRPGPGRIWRTDQSGALRMNTVIGQITIFGHDPAEPEHDAGPSFVEFLERSNHQGHGELAPNDYAPRRVYGEYLAHAFEHICAHTPSWVKVQAIRDEVVQMNPDEEAGGYTVYLREGNLRHADVVVLTTGHPRNLLRPHEQKMADFAERHGLHYVPGDSAADMPLDQVTKDDVVAIRGLGLTFYDICARLTEDRGGKFVRDEDGTLRYEPSGEEPHIVAGSRSSLPFPARGVNEKRDGDEYHPVLLTEEKVDELRERRRAEHADDRLDFQNEVLPLLMLEVHRCFTANEIRLRFDDAKADEFLALFDGGELTEERLAELRERYGVADVELPDFDKLSRPFQDESYDSTDAFQATLTEHLEQDLAEAKLGNLHGPLKASLDVIRDLRSVIRKAVEHDGLLPDSQEWFDKWYTPRNQLLSSGPPHFRVEQCVALLKSGIVEVAGPETRFRCDETKGRFLVDSPHVVGSLHEATWMIEASSPDPQLSLNRSALYTQLRADGIVAEHYNPALVATDPGRQTGGLNITEAPYRIIDASGQVREDLFTLGIPTEHTNWFTQVGSGKPGARSAFTREARMIAEGALGRVFGETVPRNFTRPFTAIGAGATQG